ncbi:hypothetical protein J2X20_000897 [Pelomonas saccharophila]|uniref:Uncharacterized protein n=1 Tax=Roseateles saccharophilus TaxID=304 RepID=A0ABU1YHH1_ROSSA|nr:hypothetical protein [Roseateles saccharophilus]MDR7268268.1 hypothetical protein [Roseateles saccharophilus]
MEMLSRPDPYSIRPAVCALIALAFLGGCASIGPDVDPDYLAVARIAFPAIEREPGSVKLVAGPWLSLQAQSALSALGRAPVAPEALARRAQDALPQGYTMLKAFDVTGDSAVFEVNNHPKCGLGSRVSMARTASEWKVVATSISVCTTHYALDAIGDGAE